MGHTVAAAEAGEDTMISQCTVVMVALADTKACIHGELYLPQTDGIEANLSLQRTRRARRSEQQRYANTTTNVDAQTVPGQPRWLYIRLGCH